MSAANDYAEILKNLIPANVTSWDRAVSSDPLADLNAMIQKIRERTERIIFCPPEMAEHVRRVVDDANLGGVITVRPDDSIPVSTLIVVDPASLTP